MHTASNVAAPDFEAIKKKQQVTWASGDFGRIGVLLQIVGESLCEAVDFRSGDRVLDVAAGNGNASLAAARRFADVTSTDYVPELLAQGAKRAEVEGLLMRTKLADAENLPFADGEFDVALSTFGVMFAPNQERAASELARVVKPGGRIGLANWTPDGFVGELFRVMSRFIAPPAGLASPFAWGSREQLVRLFGSKATIFSIETKQFVFRHPTADHWIELFRNYYGPTHKAFAALDDAGKASLRQALEELLQKFNRDANGSLVVPADYLEVVIRRA
jgi:ubiquinone/menaquinone biosynthesis C-methylase UbiE